MRWLHSTSAIDSNHMACHCQHKRASTDSNGAGNARQKDATAHRLRMSISMCDVCVMVCHGAASRVFSDKSLAGHGQRELGRCWCDRPVTEHRLKSATKGHRLSSILGNGRSASGWSLVTAGTVWRARRTQTNRRIQRWTQRTTVGSGRAACPTSITLRHTQRIHAWLVCHALVAACCCRPALHESVSGPRTSLLHPISSWSSQASLRSEAGHVCLVTWLHNSALLSRKGDCR
jgi:hypothetical protein